MDSDASMTDLLKSVDCSAEQLLQIRQDALESRLMELELRNEHLCNMQAKLEESNRHYVDLYDNAPAAYLTVSSDGLIIEANIAATELLGMAHEDLFSQCFAGFVSPVYRDYWQASCARLINYHQALTIELVLQNGLGKQVPVQLACLGSNATVRIVVTDVSKIKQASTNRPEAVAAGAIQADRPPLLNTREELLGRLQKIADSVPGVIYQYLLRPDGSSCFPYASVALFDVFRLRPEEVCVDASKVFALIHPDDVDGLIASIQASAQDLTLWYYEFRIQFDDGTVRWLLSNSIPQRETDGATLWHGFSTDITARKQVEQRLKESEARWKFAIESSGDGVWDRNMQTDHVEYSKRWREMFGYAENDALPTPQDWMNNIHGDDQAHVMALIQAPATQMSSGIRAEYRMRCKDNSYKWILSRSKIVSYSDDGQPLRMVGIHTDISERKQIEADLRNKQLQLHEAMRIARMGCWQLDFASGNFQWSEEIYGLLGLNSELPPPECCEQQDLFSADSWVQLNAAVSLIRKTAIPFLIELEMVRPNKTRLWVLIGAEVMRNAGDVITGIQGIVQDITERRRADQLVNQLQAMVAISLDGFFIVDNKGYVIEVNQAYAQMLGYSAEELTGMHLGQLEAIEDDEQIKAHIEKIIERGFDCFETRQYHKDGHEIDFEISVSYLAYYQRFCVFCRDITQRKAAERELKASESKSRSIINASPIPMALVETTAKQSNFVFLSPSFVQTFGYELAEIANAEDWWLKAYPDPAYRAWVKSIGQTVREREQKDFKPLEITICCKDHSFKTVIASYSSIPGETNLTGLIALYDITWRKQVEAQYNSIFNASVEGIITINIDNVIVVSNPAIVTIFGYIADELAGCPVQKLLPAFSHGMHGPVRSSVEQSIVKPQEIEGLHKNGNTIILELTVAEYCIDNQQYFTYIVRDITERKYREQQDKEHLDQLAHAGRLGLMGEMASGIAHEINQPLTAIATYTQFCLNHIKKENPDLSKLAEIAAKTLEQALRAGQIVNRMKRFCRSRVHQRLMSDIDELIKNSVQLCGDELKNSNIALIFEQEANLPLLAVDPIQIEQVLVNLIRNGIDAILISETRQGRIMIQSHLTPNHEIQVCVKDNGPGIDDGQKQKILMPFHTTKEHGMGMGLSISRALIEAHEGKLQFKSEFGKGSEFYFTLPVKCRHVCGTEADQ